MIYPYFLMNSSISVQPVVRLDGLPHVFLPSEEFTNKALSLMGDSKAINEWFDEMICESGASWAIGSYLENREGVLSKYPQMENDKRYFHLGIDICAPAGTPVFTPLDAVVEESGHEAGEGNYGGYAILKYECEGLEPFYILYGHMSTSSLPAVGKALKAGEKIAEIGDLHENGGWNHHTHIQVITEEGRRRGYFFKGYCNEAVLKEIELLCPNPMPIITAGFQNIE